MHELKAVEAVADERPASPLALHAQLPIRCRHRHRSNALSGRHPLDRKPPAKHQVDQTAPLTSH